MPARSGFSSKNDKSAPSSPQQFPDKIPNPPVLLRRGMCSRSSRPIFADDIGSGAGVRTDHGRYMDRVTRR